MAINATEKKKAVKKPKEHERWDVTNSCREVRESLRDLKGVSKQDIKLSGASGFWAEGK